MTRDESQHLAKRICTFYQNKADGDKIKTCHHFMEEGIHRRTITRVIQRFEERGSANFKPIPGRPAKVASIKKMKEVANLIRKEPNISMTEGAKKTHLSRNTFKWIKNNKLNIKSYKQETVPKYSGGQKERAKKACGQLYRKLTESKTQKIILMDDETYVYSDPADIPGTKYYHCTNKNLVPDENRFKAKSKFPKKYLIWQVIDELGNVSVPFISQGTMNSEVYLNECLKKILLPFINKNYNRSEIVYWMDMATCHYTRPVRDWFDSQNIEFIAKDRNAPNCPQARPIEKFWALCKKKYSLRKTRAKNLTSFKRIWKNISKKVADESGANLMKSLRFKLRKIGREGVYSLNK